MDFFPFRPYYYPQNRYAPYEGRKMQGMNQSYQEQRNKRQAIPYKEEKVTEEETKQNINNMRYASLKEDEEQKPIFEIFGLKLFFDDILIISLIFFLYNS